MLKKLAKLDAKNLTLKQKLGDASNEWMERNRSLVLRQTPIWAQSLSIGLLSLGVIGIVGGFFFRIDEVVSVSGQLRSGGTVEVETPAGGKIAETFFVDGQKVSKGQLLLSFDTRQAKEQISTLKNLIEIDKQQRDAQINSLNSQVKTLGTRLEVIQQRAKTKKS